LRRQGEGLSPIESTLFGKVNPVEAEAKCGNRALVVGVDRGHRVREVNDSGDGDYRDDVLDASPAVEPTAERAMRFSCSARWLTGAQTSGRAKLAV